MGIWWCISSYSTECVCIMYGGVWDIMTISKLHCFLSIWKKVTVTFQESFKEHVFYLPMQANTLKCGWQMIHVHVSAYVCWRHKEKAFLIFLKYLQCRVYIKGTTLIKNLIYICLCCLPFYDRTTSCHPMKFIFHQLTATIHNTSQHTGYI